MKEQLKKADLYGLLIIAAALVVYWIRSVWEVYQTVAVVLGALLTLASWVARRDEIRAGFGKRSTRFGINSGFSVLAVVGILAILNYLGNQHFKRFDMTEEKLYSLSDQSGQVVDQIEQDVTVKGFFESGENPRMRDILKLYTDRSQKIKVEFVDPEKHPEVAKQYDIVVYPAIVLEMAGNKERVQKDRPLEEDVTNALLKLVKNAKGGKKTVYFLEGHGEKQISDTSANGFSIAKEKLESENYNVKTLNLLRDEAVPADASVVVLAGPTTEPLASELDTLDSYLQRGGSVLTLLDPPPGAALAEFFKKWSIDVGNNIVIDATGQGRRVGQGPVVPLAGSYGPHPITEPLRNIATFFKLARSVTPAKPPVPDITAESLVLTSERSWAEKDLKSVTNNSMTPDPKADVLGPISLAVVATRNGPPKPSEAGKEAKEGETPSKGRMVVFGDSDFAANSSYGQLLNGDLFNNSVSWLTHDESFISIRAKDPTNREVNMTQSEQRTWGVIAIIAIPGAILLIGASVWASRRK